VNEKNEKNLCVWIIEEMAHNLISLNLITNGKKVYLSNNECENV
jgi:hypothetical protein